MQIYKKELKIYERTLEKFYILEKSCKFTEKNKSQIYGKKIHSMALTHLLWKCSV